MPYIAYMTIYALAGIVLSGMILYVWVNRKILTPNLTLVLLIGAWLWLTMQFFEYILPSSEAKMIFNKLQYMGIVLVPPAWIGFAYYFITENRKLAIRIFTLSGIACAVFLALVLTNDLHNIVWSNARLSPTGIDVTKDYSLPYYIFLGYILLLFSAGYAYFLARLKMRNRHERKWGLLILASMLLPVAGLAIEQAIPDAYSFIDPTPVCIAITSLIVIYFVRIRYYRSIPLAQHIVTESMKDLLIIINPDNQILYTNPSACGFFGRKREELAGKYISEAIPALAFMEKNATCSIPPGEMLTIGQTHFSLSVSTIRKLNKKQVGTILVLRDITRLKTAEEGLLKMKKELEGRVNERALELESINEMLKAEIVEHKKTEEKLNISISEKDILLGEIHHRVKNNLQVIMSLLKLQKKQIFDKQALDTFNTAISRIGSIAMIHEQLYKSKDLANTQFANYINQLTHEIVYLYSNSGAAIYLNVNAENITLDIDRSILCGLILNELIGNAIKHAFRQDPGEPQTQMNKLLVDFSSDEDYYVIKISDNGVGLPPEFDSESTSTLGIKIINTLVKQLSGTFSYSVNEGTQATVRFPIKKE